MKTKSCNICGDDHYARGYCVAHYMRWYRHGTPGDAAKSRSFRTSNKLDASDVVEIRRLFREADKKKRPLSYADVAEEYGLHPNYVYEIVTRRRWANAEELAKLEE